MQGIDHARNMERMWLIRSARYGDDDKERHEKAEEENKERLKKYIEEQKKLKKGKILQVSFFFAEMCEFVSKSYAILAVALSQFLKL